MRDVPMRLERLICLSLLAMVCMLHGGAQSALRRKEKVPLRQHMSFFLSVSTSNGKVNLSKGSMRDPSRHRVISLIPKARESIPCHSYGGQSSSPQQGKTQPGQLKQGFRMQYLEAQSDIARWRRYVHQQVAEGAFNWLTPWKHM